MQGGSYLLLEIDNQPIISQTLQRKLIDLKKFLNDKSINTRNYTIEDNKIFFETDSSSIDKIKEALLDKNNDVNNTKGKLKYH